MHEHENTASLCVCTLICMPLRALCVYLGCPLSVGLPYGNLNHIIFTPMATSLKACCLEVQSNHNRSHEIIMLLHSHTPLCVSGFYPKALSHVSQTLSCRQWQVTWHECVTERTVAFLVSEP